MIDDDGFDPDGMDTRKRLYAEQFVEMSGRLGREWGIKTIAWRRAFPRRKDQNASASVEAARLHNDPDVQKYIKHLQLNARQRHPATADRIIEELETLAFVNPLDYVTFDEAGNVIFDLQDIDPKLAPAISSITVETMKGGGQKTKLTFHDKNAPLMQLCRVLGINKDTINLTVAELDRLIAEMRREIEGS